MSPTTEAPALVRLGASTLDLARYAIVGPAGDTRLRPRSADVLPCLVGHAGRVVITQEILEAVSVDVLRAADPLGAEPRFLALWRALRLPELT